MERKKNAEKIPVAKQPEEQEVEFVKTGRGSLRFNRPVYLGSQKNERGTIIKPNQHFWARPSEIPKTFTDTVKPVRELPPEPPLEVVEPGYEVKPDANDPKMFNVVDMQGKVMNEQPLTEADAGALIKALR